MSKEDHYPSIVSVAVPVPLRQCFDFKLPLKEDGLPSKVSVGARVLVPFGPRKLLGVVKQIKKVSEYPNNRLKTVLEILDDEALISPVLWQLLEWLSRYYLAPIGEVVEMALSSVLRKGGNLTPVSQRHWNLTQQGRVLPIEDLQRAPLQLALIERLMRADRLTATDFKQQSSGWRQAIKALEEKGWVEQQIKAPVLSVELPPKEEPVTLNEEQALAAQSLITSFQTDTFQCSLLHGVTGSGKTEVYFAVMRKTLQAGKQVLLLVPEIGLTPQLVSRVQSQLACPISVMHSGLSDGERHLAWWHAYQGNAQVLIGTRSAVFSEFKNLGLIVVDEEHDGSFKQQDGVRYHARDVAIYRAKLANIPIVLGSATPSLESYAHAQSGRYQSLRLKDRATSAPLPKVELIDLNKEPSIDGLSPTLVEAIGATLAAKKQVMLFLNRRGYAPVLYCKECGETNKCHRCDSHLTLHKRANRSRCHHCGYEARAQSQCGACSVGTLVEVGEGTQRVEDALLHRFPGVKVLRIDRDSTRRKGELPRLLEQARSGQADILIGTQLISKGHDFPNVAMVGVLNSDQGLYSTDFRASESLFQQIVQVSGRAGRRAQTGQVLIQTHFSDHPFFAWVRQHDFDGFAQDLLRHRQFSHYPPYGFFALLRAQSTHQAKGLQFLRSAKANIHAQPGVRVMDAIAAPMERRAGQYRAQLLLCAEQRSALNFTLQAWLDHLQQDSAARKLANSVRWSIDIDPLDHY